MNFDGNTRTEDITKQLLRVADELIAHERERAEIYEEALNEAWGRIRELRQELAEYAWALEQEVQRETA